MWVKVKHQQSVLDTIPGKRGKKAITCAFVQEFLGFHLIREATQENIVGNLQLSVLMQTFVPGIRIYCKYATFNSLKVLSEKQKLHKHMEKWIRNSSIKSSSMPDKTYRVQEYKVTSCLTQSLFVNVIRQCVGHCNVYGCTRQLSSVYASLIVFCWYCGDVTVICMLLMRWIINHSIVLEKLYRRLGVLCYFQLLIIPIL